MARITGYANANDAFHQTASSPEGTGSFLAMKGALDKAGLQAKDIDYINLHGTGTQNNDIAEGTAISILFDPDYPKMSSTKAYTGHTLGASGAVEAVFSVLAIQHGIIFPNLRLETPMKEFPFQPVTELLRKPAHSKCVVKFIWIRWQLFITYFFCRLIKNMKAYIISTGNISPQHSMDVNLFFQSRNVTSNNFFKAVGAGLFDVYR